MPAASTLDMIRKLYVSGRAEAVLSVAESAWASHSSSTVGENQELVLLGEVMRIAAIAARGRGDQAGAAVWLARSRSLFACAASSTGVALTMLLDLYDALDRYGPGRTALALLDAIESVVDSGNGAEREPMPHRDVLALVAEKRAFVLLEGVLRGIEGADFDAARREYERALALVGGDARRRLKVSAAMVSVDVLSGRISTRQGAGRLEQLLEEADGNGLGHDDVAAPVRENVRRLLFGETDLLSYETFGSR
jgi:hypothetical protein